MVRRLHVRILGARKLTGHSKGRSGSIYSVSLMRKQLAPLLSSGIPLSTCACCATCWQFPVVPWCREKYLIRRAMRGILPAQVLRRSKSPLSGDPQWEATLSCGLAPLSPVRGLEKYVDSIRMPHQVNQDMMTFWADMRPRTLNYWLRNLQSKPDRFKATTAQNRYFAEHTRALKTSAGAGVA
jgi:hypothetical protein